MTMEQSCRLNRKISWRQWIWICFCSCIVHLKQTSAKGVVAAYFPEYRAYINVNNTAPYLTDLLLFSLVPNSRGMLGGCCLEDYHFKQAREARAFKQSQTGQKLKLWVTLGGAGRADSFKSVAADPKRRTRLIDALKRLW